MRYQAIRLHDKLKQIKAHWSPRVVAEMNDYQIKLVKMQGDFVWHRHQDTDETFILLQGQMRIDFRDGQVTLNEGDLYVVPKGVEHKPYSDEEVSLMLIEPVGVANTGDNEPNDRTAGNDIWL